MSSNEEKMYPADRPVRAWRRVRDENGDFVSDVAFAVGQTWEDEVPRWFNVSMVNVDGRTTVSEAKILPEETTEDDLRAKGYYRETVGGMLNFVQVLASFVMAAEDKASDNYVMAFGAKARMEQFQNSLNETYGELLKMKNADDLPEHLGLIGKYPSDVPDDDRQILVIPTYPDKWAAGEYDKRPLAWRGIIYRVIDGSKVLVVSHEIYGAMAATDWLSKGLKMASTFDVLHTLANAADTAAWASNLGMLSDDDEFPAIALVHKHDTEDGEPRKETLVYPIDAEAWEKDPNRRGGISWQAVEVKHGFDGLEVTAEWTADGVTEFQLIGQGYRPIEVNDLLDYATAFASQARHARRNVSDRSEEVGRLKNALVDALGSLVSEFCWVKTYEDEEGIRHKDIYAPSTEVDVYKMVEKDWDAVITWDKHELVYKVSAGGWEFVRTCIVEGKSRQDLKNEGASVESLTTWMVQTFHTAKDLESAHVEIKDLREKIQRLLDADSRKAGERASKMMQEFVWVNYWTSDEGTDDATEFQDVYWSRTDFEAEMIAAGSRDKPLSWFRVSMQRPYRPGGQWKVMGSESVNLLSAEKLEEYGAKAFPASQARAWMRTWSSQVLEERGKASHPSQGPADAYIRAEKAEADVAYWKAKAEEAEAREKALEVKHKNDMEALVADAHQWADENELCSAFDEFMEEHGLPARLRDWTVKVEVPITLEFTVEDMSNAEDAGKEAERYVEQELRGLNDIAGMDVAWVGDPDGDYVEVVGD